MSEDVLIEITMYKYKDIKQIHLEITEKCQAVCPMCPRNLKGGKDNPHLINAELSLEDCKKIFKPAFIKQLDVMFMCGNYGDPMMAKDTLEVYKYFRKHNPKLWLSMHTNGGARTAKWWAELAKTIGTGNSDGCVTFSVDGLEDTNHIYRKNVKWKNVERNMRSYIDAGGQVRWHFLAFKHNEHQFDEAKALAKEWGVYEFLIKKTSRFYGQLGLLDDQENKKYEFQVYDKKGNPEYIIEPPSEKKYLNREAMRAGDIFKKYRWSSMKDFDNKTTIDPKCISKKEIYVSARGLILPCCWIGGTLYRWELGDDYKEEQVWGFINRAGGPDAINAVKPWNTIESIIDRGQLFNYIEKSWDIPTVEQGKVRACARHCPVGFDKFSEQFT